MNKQIKNIESQETNTKNNKLVDAAKHWTSKWRETETWPEWLLDRITDPIPVVNMAVDQHLYRKKTKQMQSMLNQPTTKKFPTKPLVGIEPNPGPKVEVKIQETKSNGDNKNKKQNKNHNRKNNKRPKQPNATTSYRKHTNQRMSKILRPYMSADNAAVAWRQHLLDPWNYPPIHLGRTMSKSAIGWAYVKTVYNSAQVLSGLASAADAYIWSVIPGYYSATGAIQGAGSLAGGNWVMSLSLTGAWSNIATIASMANQYRPISCGMRVALRFPSTTMPPYLFAGSIPAGIPAGDLTSIGSTAATTPTVTRGTITTKDTNKNAFAISWVPQDEVEIINFSNTYGGGVVISTMPYIGFLGASTSANAWSCEFEALSFFEYEQNYSNLNYATAEEPSILYTGSELWDAYSARGFASDTAHVPVWTTIHEKNSSFTKFDGGPIVNTGGSSDHKSKEPEVVVSNHQYNKILNILSSPNLHSPEVGELTLTPSKYDELCRVLQTIKVVDDDFEVTTPVDSLKRGLR